MAIGWGRPDEGAGGEALRLRVATVGKPGRPGADVRCVVSVAMLSEGWVL